MKMLFCVLLSFILVLFSISTWANPIQNGKRISNLVPDLLQVPVIDRTIQTDVACRDVFQNFKHTSIFIYITNTNDIWICRTPSILNSVPKMPSSINHKEAAALTDKTVLKGLLPG